MAMVIKLKKIGLVLICISMMITACGFFSKKKPPSFPEPTHVVVEFEAAGAINPNTAGRPSPLVLRIYYLKSYSAFENADFIALFERDEETLGKALVHKREILLSPSEKRTVYLETSDETRTIGILAAFRNYDKGRWKVAAGVQENKTNVVNVFVSGTNIEIK